MNEHDNDNEAAECHRHAAALYASLLVADTDSEISTAMRQVADGVATYIQMLVIGSLAGSVSDLLDTIWEFDDPERLEWIAHRVDVIAKAPA